MVCCIQKVCRKVQILTQNMTFYQVFYLAFKRYAKKTPDFDAKYDLLSSILTCIQKVCKKTPDFDAKYDYVKNSNLHSKSMQKLQIFTQNMTLYQVF